MQVVHGLWTTGRKEGPGLLLWFEDAALRMQTHLFEPISDFTPGQEGSVKGGSGHTPLPHPYSCQYHQFRSEDLEQLFACSVNQLNFVDMDLLLPTFEDSPFPSPWLSSKKTTVNPSDLHLTPWRVQGIFLEPTHALKWLFNLNLLRRNWDMVFSQSVRFWKDAANLVFYSLIHGTYEPILRKVDHQIQCNWVLNSKILSNQLENLQARLPGLCESEWHQNGSRRTREAIVRDFFDTSIDHMVRQVAGKTVMDQLPHVKSSRKRKKQNPLDLLTMPLLKGIYNRQNSFVAPRDVQAAFVALVTNWLKQTAATQSKSWHTCFTVLPPEIGDAKLEDLDPRAKVWRIAFSLQNLKDPEKHIYAQEIWDNLVPTERADGTILAEQLLRDLGRAVQHFPEMRPALDRPYPTHVDLTCEEAYNFLTEQSRHLSQAEFGIVAPPWWKKDTKPLKTKLKIDSSAFDKAGMMGFDTTVQFAWKASVGNRQLSDEAFEKLVKHKMALLPIDGQWVEVKPEDLFEAITFFENRETLGPMALKGEMTLMDAMQMGLEKEDLREAMEHVQFDYEGSIAQLFQQNLEKVPEIEQPKALDGTLRPYQLRGLSWLAFHHHLGFGACLADDMGLGKTIQLLSLLLYERQIPSGKGKKMPTLLVCPMSVVGNWFREALRFAPSLRALIHHGTQRDHKSSFMRRYREFDLIITTYHLINRDAEIFGQIEWHRVALDEAQNIKNPAAQQSQAIQALKTKNRIALTGTPVENKLSELWSIFEFLNPGYLGSLKSFQTRFATPIEKQADKEKSKLLRQLTQPFILRRLKTDKSIIQDLPEKIEMKVYCDLTEEQASIYQAYVQQQLVEIEKAEGIMRNQLVLTTLMRLKQICNHPTQFFKDESEIHDRSGKLMRLKDMLEEALAEGDKSLIFTQFTEMGTILDRYLSKTFGTEVLFMHGGVSQTKRQEMVDRFQTKQGPRVFILTVKTGGTGLNLTAANHVFHYDRWWNPAVENQATDRAFRIGQKQSVQVHKLIAIGTLEDRIDMMIEKKKELAENIIGGDESWLGQLSTEALREVITLSAEKGG